MGFVDSGWSLNNGIVTAPAGSNKWAAYRLILEAIYDGHIPITRVVGYHISSSTLVKNARGSRIFERDINSADDRLTIAANLSELLIPGYPGEQIHTLPLEGRVTIDKLKVMVSQKEIPVLSSNEYILTTISAINLDLALSESVGYKNADYNYDIILKQRGGRVSKTRFFPIYSYHCLVKFIRVLPFDGTIRLVYRHGMSDAILLPMLEKMFTWSESKIWLADKLMEVKG